MINKETFSELMEKYPYEYCWDFILKSIQADVILSKTKVTKKNMNCFLETIIKDNAHNNIEKCHYEYAIELYTFQCMLKMKGIGGCNPVLPQLPCYCG